MSKVTMLNMAGKEAGQIELKDEIFGIRAESERGSCGSEEHFSESEDREHSLRRPELKSEEEAESLSDRREQDATDREAPQTLHR